MLEAVNVSAEVVAAILGISITVVAIIVQLAATRYNHHITEMFVREPINVVVQACQGNSAFFHVSQLGSLREVIEQAEMFIRHREQLAKLSCPGCGETPFPGELQVQW